MDNQFARVQIQGMVASIPMVRYTAMGTPVATMTVSVKRERKGKAHTIDYLEIVVIGNEGDAQAEDTVCFEQGQFVSIEGQLVERSENIVRGKETIKKRRMVVKALSIVHCECAVS